MKAQPVLILKPNGDVAVPMDATDLLPIAKDASLAAILAAQALQVQTGDLAPLAKDASLAAILAAIDLQPKTATKAVQVTISLAGALVNAPVALGGLQNVYTITVRDLTGATIPTLRINGIAESPLALAKGEERSGLDATSLHISTVAGGGSLVLELLGR